MSTRPLFSVIVPAYNAAQTLDDCLGALGRQTVPRGEYEVIVVDDGSLDTTPQVAAAHSVGIVTQPHQGPAAARNAGFRAAKGEIVLFIDADCVPLANWIEQLVAPFDLDGVVGVGGLVRTKQVGVVPRYIQLEYDIRYDRVAQSNCVDFVSSATAAYLRSILEAVGGFDAALHGAEDAELSFRLAEAGYKLVFKPDAVVYHRHPQSVATYLRRKLHYGYWRVEVYRRYPGKVLADSRTPQWQKLQLVLVPLACICAVVSLAWRPLWFVFGSLVAVFGLSSFPFLQRAWRADKWVGFLSPLLLFASAGATAIGLALGVLEHILWRSEDEVPRRRA